MPEPPGFVVKNGTNKFVEFMIPRTFIVHIHLDALAHLTPADRHATVRLKRGIDGIIMSCAISLSLKGTFRRNYFPGAVRPNCFGIASVKQWLSNKIIRFWPMSASQSMS